MRGGRPKAPPCPKCGKALYKHPEKGTRVKKHWPYAWCRNDKCKLHGKDQTQIKPVRKRKKQKAPDPTWKPTSLPIAESEAIKQARDRISKAIGGGPPPAVALALAVLAQEIGSYKAASQIIDDFDLTTKFGIQKVDLND